MSDYLEFDETGTIVTGYKGYPKNVFIPDGVIEIIEIKGSAYCGCSHLASTDIPNSVK